MANQLIPKITAPILWRVGEKWGVYRLKPNGGLQGHRARDWSQMLPGAPHNPASDDKLRGVSVCTPFKTLHYWQNFMKYRKRKDGSGLYDEKTFHVYPLETYPDTLQIVKTYGSGHWTMMPKDRSCDPMVLLDCVWGECIKLRLHTNGNITIGDQNTPFGKC